MSRKIDVSDPSKLTEDDIRYLQERDRLPSGVEPIDTSTDVRAGSASLPDEPVTGDVGTSAPDGGQAIPDPGDVRDYDSMSTAQLKAEIDVRNEGRDSDSRISKAGGHDALAARLREDDESTTIEEE